MRTYGSAPLGHYPATTRAYNNVNSGNRPMGVMPVNDREHMPMGVMPINDREHMPMGVMPIDDREHMPMGVMPINDREHMPMGVMPIDNRDIRPTPQPIPRSYPRNKNIRPMESKADRLFASIIMLFLMMQNVKMR